MDRYAEQERRERVDHAVYAGQAPARADVPSFQANGRAEPLASRLEHAARLAGDAERLVEEIEGVLGVRQPNRPMPPKSGDVPTLADLAAETPGRLADVCRRLELVRDALGQVGGPRPT